MPAFVLNRGQPNEVRARSEANPLIRHRMKLLFQSFSALSSHLVRGWRIEGVRGVPGLSSSAQSVTVVPCRWRWTLRL